MKDVENYLQVAEWYQVNWDCFRQRSVISLACICLRMCGWSNPITTPNQSPVAVLVAKKKQAPHSCIWGPWFHIYWQKGPIHLWECGKGQVLSPQQTRAQWLFWLLRKSRPFKVAYGALGPISINFRTHLPLILCKWSNSFTTPNQSPVAVLVAKKRYALHILIWAPGAYILQHMGFIYHCV